MCDISSLRVNGPSEPGRLRDVCVCQWVNFGCSFNRLSAGDTQGVQRNKNHCAL